MLFVEEHKPLPMVMKLLRISELASDNQLGPDQSRYLKTIKNETHPGRLLQPGPEKTCFLCLQRQQMLLT